MRAPDDPGHPCFLENAIDGVEHNVKWLAFRIDEHVKAHARLCLLDYLPRWKMSRAPPVVIREGEPVAIGSYDLNIKTFDIM
jgi:hypothetical protein